MPKWTSEDVYEYLKQQYVTIDWLAERSGLTAQQIDELVREKCIPGPSYEIFETAEVAAFTSNNPTELARKTIGRHFSPSVLAWIDRAKPLLAGLRGPELREHLKRQFLGEYREGLVKNAAQQINYRGLFDGDGTLSESRFQDHFEQTWNHWWNGTWGICVIQSDSFERITRKQIAVERLIQLTEDGKKLSFSEVEAFATKMAIAMYEEIVPPFSRHDHRDSSRLRLVENVLPRLGEAK